MSRSDRSVRRSRRAGTGVLLITTLAVWLTVGPTNAGVAALPARLDPRAQATFEAYLVRVNAEFQARVSGQDFLWLFDDRSRARQVLEGQVVAGAGDSDGILSVPGGLIHHWIATVFLPDMSLSTVMARERSYADYPAIYRPVVEAELVEAQGDIDRIRLRLAQRTRWVGATVDAWWTRRHAFPASDRAYIAATSDVIRQVEDAGTPRERLLPEGEGGGYLWMAASFTKLLERDGGVYVEFQTVGLSRGFPRFLGWLVEPIARRIGRGSVETTLEQLRASFARVPAEES